MRYLSAQEILIVHALVVDETGGSHGVRDIALLESIAHKPQTRFGGKELYKGVFVKAAALLEAVVNYHVFVDGNKRTALIVAGRFFAINSYELQASNKDMEALALAVATKKMDSKDVAVWLKRHGKKRT